MYFFKIKRYLRVSICRFVLALNKLKTPPYEKALLFWIKKSGSNALSF
jgi:hypothetical protein